MLNSEQQHQELLMALSEIQATLDGIALDTQAVREHYWGREPSELSVEPWVNGGLVQSVEQEEGYPPPERGNMGAAVGIIVLAALAGSLASIIFMLHLIGS